MYKVTITTPEGSTVLEFSTEELAKKEVKHKCKELNLIRFKGFYGNPKTSTELTTNF